MKSNKSVFFTVVSGFMLLTGSGHAFVADTALEQLFEAAANTPAAYEDAVVRGGSVAALAASPAAYSASAAPAPSALTAAGNRPALTQNIKGMVPGLRTVEKSSEGAVVGGYAGFMGGFLLVMSPAVVLGLIPFAGKILAPIATVVLFVPAVVVGAVTGLVGALVGGIAS